MIDEKLRESIKNVMKVVWHTEVSDQDLDEIPNLDKFFKSYEMQRELYLKKHSLKFNQGESKNGR